MLLIAVNDLFSRDAIQQIVGRERRERVSQLEWCGGGCFDSRRRVNSSVGPHLFHIMKRLFLSITGGVILPVVYFLFLWLIVSIVKLFNVPPQNESWWFYILILPLEWGGRFYNFLFPARFEKPFALLRGPAIVSDLGGAFLLFSLLTYALLWYQSRRKRTVEVPGVRPQQIVGRERRERVSHHDWSGEA